MQSGEFIGTKSVSWSCGILLLCKFIYLIKNQIENVKEEVVMGKGKNVKVSQLTEFEKKWYKVTRAIVIFIALYITAGLIPTFEAGTDNSNAVVILQYLPLCMTIAISFLGGIPALLRAETDNVVLDTEAIKSLRRLMTPRTKENSSELGLLLYYIWEVIVIISQIVLLVLAVINGESFSDKIINFFLGIIMGLISYASLTGQGYVTTSKGKKKRWTRGISPNRGREYLPSDNVYRDEHGRYYNLNGTPIAPPVSKSKKSD